MDFWQRYRFCPVCGGPYVPESWHPEIQAFDCARCSYRFYQNSKPSAVALVPRLGDPRQILLITRASPPSAGKLALPGGFLGYGEAPDLAAVRETLEESGLLSTPERMLCCQQVDYEWNGDRIWVLETSYQMRPAELPTQTMANDEISGLGFYVATDVLADRSLLAFPGHYQVIELYLSQSGRPESGTGRNINKEHSCHLLSMPSTCLEPS